MGSKPPSGIAPIFRPRHEGPVEASRAAVLPERTTLPAGQIFHAAGHPPEAGPSWHPPEPGRTGSIRPPRSLPAGWLAGQMPLAAELAPVGRAPPLDAGEHRRIQGVALRPVPALAGAGVAAFVRGRSLHARPCCQPGRPGSSARHPEVLTKVFTDDTDSNHEPVFTEETQAREIRSRTFSVSSVPCCEISGGSGSIRAIRG
jgi:hypothetical protein